MNGIDRFHFAATVLSSFHASIKFHLRKRTVLFQPAKSIKVSITDSDQKTRTPHNKALYDRRTTHSSDERFSQTCRPANTSLKILIFGGEWTMNEDTIFMQQGCAEPPTSGIRNSGFLALPTPTCHLRLQIGNSDLRHPTYVFENSNSAHPWCAMMLATVTHERAWARASVLRNLP
uniref:Uncharacterized protein n=1 Tax=Steinernema glaseri TaxID=37863 RepID=A0A1I7ZE90_9BILA